MRAVALCLAALDLLACDPTSTASSAASTVALLRVDGAQIVPGPPPDEDTGPGVQGIQVLATRIWPGQVGKSLTAVLDERATAAALHWTGDAVHYVVPAGAPDVTAPTLPTVVASLSLAPWLDLGPHALAIYAVDAAGRYGRPRWQRFDAVADPAAPALPQSWLQILLRWDRAADLDLHVQEPSGRVVWSRHKAGAAGMGSGVLDFDSNAACVLDGQQREQVRYLQPPPSGRYRVRVDTFSLCQQATAYWSLAVYRMGHEAPLFITRGQSLASDTRGPHGADSGVLALELDLP